MENTENWYAIKTRRVFEAERGLEPLCESVYLPRETVRRPDGHVRVRPVIPGLMFVRVAESRALSLEAMSQRPDGGLVPFRIYRNVAGTRIQAIGEREIWLMRLLTSEGPDRCEVYRKDNFREGDAVRVTGGAFAGYRGRVRRIRRNAGALRRLRGSAPSPCPSSTPTCLSLYPSSPNPRLFYNTSRNTLPRRISTIAYPPNSPTAPTSTPTTAKPSPSP